MRPRAMSWSNLQTKHPKKPHLAWKATSPTYHGEGALFFCHHPFVARQYAIAYFRTVGGVLTAGLDTSKVKVRRAPEFDKYLLKDDFGRPYQAHDIDVYTDEQYARDHA